MTGFKDGASSSPYNGDDDGEDEQRDGGDDAHSLATDETLKTDSRDVDGDASGRGDGLPWIYDRSGITDGRDKTVQLHLQEETVDEEDEFQRRLKSVLGEKPQKADIREASYLVAMEHLDEVAAKLREWGYDFE